MSNIVHLSVFTRAKRTFKFDMAPQAFKEFEAWVKDGKTMIPFSAKTIHGSTIYLVPGCIEAYADCKNPHPRRDESEI